ncbi:MAG: hypothetical protein ACLFSQ_08240 [Candidatus Zixiibacteriota bacterium]
MTKIRDDIDVIFGDVIKDSNTISIIGNGRGSGKTTAFKAFLKYLSQKYTVGISSFGNDRARSQSFEPGFAKSGLVFVNKGTLIATSRNSLGFSDITKEILITTGINTPLGEIVILRALSSGYALLTGASTIDESIRIKNLLVEFGAQKIIFDGSVNRKSPATHRLSDSFALTFALRPDMLEMIRREMDIFNTQLCDDFYRNIDGGNYIIKSDNRPIYLNDLDLEISQILNENRSPIKAIGISGALQSNFVKRLLHLSENYQKQLSKARIIIDDATRIFIKDIERMQLEDLGIRINVRNKISVNSIFINPAESGFSSDEIDALMVEIAYGIPVFDILRGVYFEGI